ncbi:unnamed protein product [Cochlearia groenlandica]
MKKKTKKNRMLVSINVVGSTGPIRFVVKEDETVKRVIDITLKCYAHQGRLPLFSSSLCTSSFLLYARCSLVQRKTASRVSSAIALFIKIPLIYY